MRITRRAFVPTAAAVLLTVTAMGAQATAATPAAPAAVTAKASPAPVAGATSAATADDATMAAAAAYWTPERMRNAIPLDSAPQAAAPAAREAAAAERPVAGSPFTVEPVEPTVADSGRPERDAMASIPSSKAAGKVFFRNPKDGRNYVCSASALNSRSRQLVTTAGHCVHGGRGGKWMTNWVYAPRYANGRAPYGVFPAKSWRTFTAWITSSSFARDVAMVTTAKVNGRKLVSVTGGHGISVNYDHTQNVYVLGYPSNKYRGEVQMWCHGNTRRETGSNRLAIRCTFGPGASGGPWLRKYNTRTGLGYVNNVMSTWNPNTGWNQAAYFDTAVLNLYKAQANVT
ncbi:trypsin-like serine peptidase [Streptomyces sp. NPDC093225]|uniref:trypsin-like serine peptidase n=1 Tax=Streptomyces sp. NPDC093225 TaxID=3366034 RepID=UPI0037F6EEE3